MKKTYLNPALEVVAINKQDIVTASTTQYDASGNLKMGLDLDDVEYGL